MMMGAFSTSSLLHDSGVVYSNIVLLFILVFLWVSKYFHVHIDDLFLPHNEAMKKDHDDGGILNILPAS
jgi:hypothetical protein